MFLVFVATFTVLAGIGVVQAQRPDPYAGLTSPDREAVIAAIDAVAADKSQRAINALSDRIENGLPPALLDHAVDVLVAIGRGPAARVLTDLAQHRRVEVRVKVAAAMVTTRAPNARQTLTAMLDDPSTLVRTAAARALGELGARPAMRELTAAALRGLGEAIVVVGAQANAMDVARAVRTVEASTLTAYAPLLSAFATRADLPLRTRTQVLDKLVELASPGCHTLLEALVTLIPEADPAHQPAVEALGALRAKEEEANTRASPIAPSPAEGSVQ